MKSNLRYFIPLVVIGISLIIVFNAFLAFWEYINIDNYIFIDIVRTTFWAVATILSILGTIIYVKDPKFKKMKIWKKILYTLLFLAFNIVLAFYSGSILLRYLDGGIRLNQTNTLCELSINDSRRGPTRYLVTVRDDQGYEYELESSEEIYFTLKNKYGTSSRCKSIGEKIYYENIFHTIVKLEDL